MARPRRDRAEDMEAIRLFLDRTRRVESSTIVRQNLGTKFEISWRQGEPLRWTSTEPNDELMTSLVTLLRPLVVLGESVNLRAIYDIAERRLTSDDHRRAMREVREAWKRAQRQGMVSLKVDGRDLSPEYVMRLWINSYYSHAEPALEAELRSLGGGIGPSRQVFTDLIYRAIECVIYTASVLQDAIDRQLLI